MSQIWNDDVPASTRNALNDLDAIRNNFAAIKSMFSGTSAPSDLVAGMIWLDTTNHILKVRNEANSAWLSIWDMSNNKPIVTNLSGDIDTAQLASGAVTSAKLDAAVLASIGEGATQIGYGGTALWSSLGSTAFPADDTVPLYTEGNQAISISYTPASASSVLHVHGTLISVSTATNQWGTLALFRSSSCLRANMIRWESTTYPKKHTIDAYISSPGTSSYTFQMRVGCTETRSIYMNGDSSGRLLGGATASFILIKEFEF